MEDKLTPAEEDLLRRGLSTGRVGEGEVATYHHAHAKLQRARTIRDGAAPKLLAALEMLDAHLDFSVPWKDGDLGIEDASGINEAMRQARRAIEEADG